MRFLFLSLGVHPDTAGGADRYVTELAETLVSRGHQCVIVCPRVSPKCQANEVREGLCIHRFRYLKGPFWFTWPARNLFAWRRARPFLVDGSDTIVVLCHALLSLGIVGATQQAVYSYHGPWAEEFLSAQHGLSKSRTLRALDRSCARVFRRVEREALSRVRQILVVSEYSRRSLVEWHPGLDRSPRVVGAGVDLEHFQRQHDRTGIRELLGVGPDDFLILTVRRLAPRMGLLTLLEAFHRIRDDFPSARLCLAGRGPMETALRRRITEMGMEDRIRLLGYVPEERLPGLFTAADCTVMPSTALEGFGLVTIESLACGTPVIGSDLGGTPEILRPFWEEGLFRPGSVSALAEKLSRVITSRKRLPSPEACRAYAEEQYRWTATAEAFESVGRELLGGMSEDS